MGTGATALRMARSVLLAGMLLALWIVFTADDSSAARAPLAAGKAPSADRAPAGSATRLADRLGSVADAVGRAGERVARAVDAATPMPAPSGSTKDAATSPTRGAASPTHPEQTTPSSPARDAKHSRQEPVGASKSVVPQRDTASFVGSGAEQRSVGADAEPATVRGVVAHGSALVTGTVGAAGQTTDAVLADASETASSLGLGELTDPVVAEVRPVSSTVTGGAAAIVGDLTEEAASVPLPVLDVPILPGGPSEPSEPSDGAIPDPGSLAPGSGTPSGAGASAGAVAPPSDTAPKSARPEPDGPQGRALSALQTDAGSTRSGGRPVAATHVSNGGLSPAVPGTPWTPAGPVCPATTAAAGLAFHGDVAAADLPDALQVLQRRLARLLACGTSEPSSLQPLPGFSPE